MSSKDFNLSVKISAKDDMSKQADAAFKKMTKSAIDASTGIMRSNNKIMSGQQRMYQDRERLGIRSEQRIQREIKVTEAAYSRLMRSGSLSMREQTRATEAMRSKVQQLNNEMGKLSKMQRAMNGGRAIAGLAAGGFAAGMVVKPQIDKAMDYDLRLANMANTAFAGQSISKRRAGKNILDAEITNAVRASGGLASRDIAGQALNTIFATGAMPDAKSSLKILTPTLKAAIAANGDATDFATVGARAVQNMGVNVNDISKVYDYTIGGGQAGSFESKDLAKYLPQQFGVARGLGYGGLEGVKKLISYNQAAATTAGTSDEAGNNLTNLLNKINSRDTALDVKKNLGINLPKYLAESKLKGIDSVTAFSNLIDKSQAKNPLYQKLQKELAGAKDDSTRKATLASMVDIVQGSSMGLILQDIQAVKAAVGISNSNKNGYLTKVNASMVEGVANDNLTLLNETASAKTGALNNEKEIAQQAAMSGLTNQLGDLSTKVAEIAREYPALTTATVAATTALTALAAAGLGAAGVGVLTGGKGAMMKGAAARALPLLKGAAGFGLKRALPLYAAWQGGQLAGGAINSGLNWGVNKFTDSGSLGGLIYDLTHKEQKLDGNLSITLNDNRSPTVKFSSNQPNLKTTMANGRHMATQ